MPTLLQPAPSTPPAAVTQLAGMPPRLSRRTQRLLVYLLALGTLASIICFHGLGESVMGGDEALYATVMDNMWESGDWLQPTVRPGRYHLHKPPLYYWFSATTHGFFEDGEFRYRFWAAVFGVGCVLLTAIAGGMFFTPEVGLIAGLTLLLNRNFVFVHSARSGTFDTGLTFFMLASVILYWRLACGKQRKLGWVLTGVAAGAACLFKPFVVSGCMLTILSAHYLFTQRLEWRQRLVGPVLGGLTCLAVMGPWHVIMWWRLGDLFLTNFVGANIVQRATTGVATVHLEGPFFYLFSLAESSRMFHWLAWPAIVLAGIVARTSVYRRELLLLTSVTLAFVGLLSLSASKLITYIYPIYPLVSLLVAGMLWLEVPRFCRTRWPRVDGRVWLAGVLIAATLFLRADAKRIRLYLNMPAVPYGPLALQEKLTASATGRGCQMILYGLPSASGKLNFDRKAHASDVFYARYLPDAQRAANVEQLLHMLDQKNPTVIVCAPAIPAAELEKLQNTSAPISTGVLPTKEGERFTVLCYGVSFDELGLTAWMAEMKALQEAEQSRIAQGAPKRRSR